MTGIRLKRGRSKCSLLFRSRYLIRYLCFDTSARLRVRCDLPNSSIHFFNGNITVNEETIVGLSAQNLLLRGCRLKNTTWALGFVTYTGKQSKVVMNSRSVPSKLSFLEKTMNSLIHVIFFGQILLSFISLITYVVWNTINQDNLIYLCYNYSDAVTSLWKDSCESTTEYTNIAYFVTFFILYNNFIPISLYVTVELVNYFQAHFFESDVDMYHAESDQPALARTSNMNSDLGMVEYIFSDKTGTLTDNIMKFRMCSVAGQVYVASDPHITTEPTESDSEADYMFPLSMSEVEKSLPFAPHAQNISQFQIIDQTNAEEFALILGICHSVVIDTETKEFRTESPDEEALVHAASHLGWTFIGRRLNEIMLTNNQTGQQKVYEVLALIPFDSTRKRMSTVVREVGSQEILLFSKGADNVMFDLADKVIPIGANVSVSPSVSPTALLEDHLKGFAGEGLRTLLVAKRVLTLEEYEHFATQWNDADCALSGREAMYAVAAELVEKNLTIVGATAIEDKLQDGVPETIADLRSAGEIFFILLLS
jgi:phospholipid-transporting ATPase